LHAPSFSLPSESISRRLPVRYRLLLACAILLNLTSSVLAQGSPAASDPRTVIVGGDHNYPPYEFLDKNGHPDGYNVELTRAIAEVMGMNAEIRLGSWGEMRQALAAGRVDILQGMAYAEDRLGEVDYSPPHTIVYQSIWTRRGTPPPQSIDYLRNKEVIVMARSVMHDFMSRHPELAATIIPVSTLSDALRLLATGKHDCALVAKLPGEYLAREFGLDMIVPTARPIAEQPYGYAVRKGNTEMLSRFSEGLALLKKAGRYQQIHNKWLGVLEPHEVSWGRVIRYLAMVVGPLLLILGGTVIWSRTLKREVAQRTEALEREVAERKLVIEELQVRQRQLIQADKMTSLGILVSGVAHEVNNPTGLILLNVPLLQKAYGDAEPVLEAHYEKHGDFRLGWLHYSRMREEIPKMLNEMHDGAKRIKRIVEDLKDFARRDDADLSGAVDLNAVVSAAIRLVDNSIKKATDSFSVFYEEELPRVRGNAQRIEQVVVNLILNACQALPDKEKGIFIRTFADAAQGAVIVEVRDEGGGIAPEHLPHLTDPFFTTRREEGGTGLGLSVSAGIVKEHGGSLRFDSSPGAGVTVTLALPAPPQGVL
jgi:polar amino acid transport system substrate-binding protein